MVSPAIFVLGPSAMLLAQRLRAALGDDAQVHCPEGVQGGDVHYAGATQHLRSLFGRGHTIVGVCASGILIRAVAPLLNDKQTEPPVIAVAEDGSSVVPLLGGHHGGNALARRLAETCSGHAAITTAGDVRFGVSLDEPPDGYILSSPPTAKRFMSALIAGEPVRIEGNAPWLSGLHQAPDARLTIRITDRENSADPDTLLIHPQVLAVGVGCERGTEPAELEELVTCVLQEHKISDHSVACFATIDLKEDEPAVLNLKNHPVRFFSVEELRAEAWRVRNPSHIVESEIGVSSVAEAAALAAAGADGRLIVEKTKSRRATCAIAQSPRPILDFAGRGRGQLTIVGIGPGAASERTVKSVSVLKAATDWVGYGYYLDLVRDLKSSQTLHRFALGEEETRVRHAIFLAKQGRRVCLVCSGDPSIYAMACLVFEVVELDPSCRVAIDVVPGVSAFQTASARAGGIIGHDFCCISLSDLLTPWEFIERRLQAAAAGDFVVALYNPRSSQRRDHLKEAIRILRGHRPPETPVVVASKLGRDGERVNVVTLAAFDASSIDMMTVVVVGSSQSRSFARGDGAPLAFTPRGYARNRVPA